MRSISLLYVSTSRKPSQKTRSLARWLERLFGGESENRGKRSVREIAARMEAKGFKRAVFVYEKHGNPFSLNFLDAEDGWLYPEIVISGFEVLKGNASGRLPAVTSAEAEDGRGRDVLRMLDFGKAEVDDGLRLAASARELAFYEGKEKVFSISIRGFNDKPAGEDSGDTGWENAKEGEKVKSG